MRVHPSDSLSLQPGKSPLHRSSPAGFVSRWSSLQVPSRDIRASGHASRRVHKTTFPQPTAGPESDDSFGFCELTARIADSSSRNAVSFSSARTTKRFPSSRCASAIQIVRPLESIADTQPQLQPALLRLSAITSEFFIRFRAITLMIMPVGHPGASRFFPRLFLARLRPCFSAPCKHYF